MENVFNYLKEQLEYQLDMVFLIENQSLKPVFKKSSQSYINQLIQQNNLSDNDIILLGLSLVPNIKPHFLSSIVAEYLPNGGEISEFGGAKSKNHRGILPTAETAQFIVAGNNLEERIAFYDFFHNHSFLLQKGIVKLDSVPICAPKMSGLLFLDEKLERTF
jgi:hypothetical protein